LRLNVCGVHDVHRRKAIWRAMAFEYVGVGGARLNFGLVGRLSAKGDVWHPPA
jgi:hypothetical protein